MLKHGGDVVHAAVYHIILGVWHTESALAGCRHPHPKEGGQHRLRCILHHCVAEHSRQGICPAHQGTPLGGGWLQEQLLEQLLDLEFFGLHPKPWSSF